MTIKSEKNSIGYKLGGVDYSVSDACKYVPHVVNLGKVKRSKRGGIDSVIQCF